MLTPYTSARLEQTAGLYHRHRRAVLARCRRLLGECQAAEDAAQETFLRAYRYPGDLPPPEHQLAWLSRIATNYCLNQMRDRGRRAELVRIALRVGPELQMAEALVDRDLIRRLIARVPPALSEVACLYHVAGHEQSEVARQLGVSRRTVVNRIAAFERRARALLAAGEETPRVARFDRRGASAQPAHAA